MFEEYDSVELMVDLAPDLKRGTRGAIVMVYLGDPPGYEVEFFDQLGQTLAVRTIREDQLRKVVRGRTS